MNYDSVQLGDISEAIRGVTYSGGEASPNVFDNSLACITTSGVQETMNWDSRRFVPRNRLANDKQLLREGDIVISTANSKELVGKSCIVDNLPFECTFGAFVTAIRPNRKVMPDYLAYWMRTKEFLDKCYLMSSNTTNISNLRTSELLEFQIPLPPLTEQKRIASLLARADRLRQLRRTAHDLGDALLQSVFLEMFGDVAHSKWDKSELGELIDDFEAGVNYLPGSEGEKTSEWRVLKISAVTWGDFDPTESKAIREYDEFDEKHIVRQGDLLISRANTPELVGAVSLVKIIPPKVLLPDKLWRVKFKEDSAILPEYTLHVLRQPALRKIIGDLATGSSGSMKNISMEKAATLPIPVPPLSLQEEFASVVARVESLQGRMGESERQVEGLFESLLAEVFT